MCTVEYSRIQWTTEDYIILEKTTEDTADYNILEKTTEYYKRLQKTRVNYIRLL